MTISEIEKELELIKKEHGDLTVTTFVHDVEYGDCYNIGIKIDVNPNIGTITIR